MYLIEDGLFQGPRPSKIPSHITAIVNLEADTDGPSMWKDFIGNVDTAQVFLPIYDADYPGHKWLTMAVCIVEALRAGGKSVYIHCRGGISRSVMLTAAVLMKKHRWDVDKAMNFIAQANPGLNANPRFMDGLEEWHKSL